MSHVLVLLIDIAADAGTRNCMPEMVLCKVQNTLPCVQSKLGFAQSTGKWYHIWCISLSWDHFKSLA